MVYLVYHKGKNIMSTTKIIAVVGPTSSGKSELAVLLAKKFNGEIISADSRQVYKKMDLGSGKVEGNWKTDKTNGRSFYEYKGIIHHAIDFLSPKKQYSSSEFQTLAKKLIRDISSRNRISILCGGTGHWLDAVINGQLLPEVKPNLKLRKKLEKQTTAQLYAQLKKLDKRRAQNIDRNNPRRLIRALEIALATGKPIPLQKNLSPYVCLWIGIYPGQAELYKKIKTRLEQRLKAGMLREIKKIHAQGISWKRLESFGLEYKFCALLLQKKISANEMRTLLFTAIRQYSKRQMTWFKKNKNIHWIKNTGQASKLVKKFSST